MLVGEVVEIIKNRSSCIMKADIYERRVNDVEREKSNHYCSSVRFYGR